jgi:hypothetical protein
MFAEVNACGKHPRGAVKYKPEFSFKHLLVQNKNTKQIYCFST